MPAVARGFIHIRLLILAFVAACCCLGSAAAQAPDPLPSWNDGPVKKSITDFVPRVTTAGSPDFVPRDQRIATFDNDGTLWAEQPMYFSGVSSLCDPSRRNELRRGHPRHTNTTSLASIEAPFMNVITSCDEPPL